MLEDTELPTGNSEDTVAAQQVPGVQAPRIAVLPFHNGTANPDLDYFCDGLAAEVLIGLARIPGLHLVARSCVFALDWEALSDREIGTRLEATAILHGRVVVDQNRLQVDAVLVDAGTEQQLWAGQFDRMLQDVFTVLDDIVSGVADTVSMPSATEQVRNIQSMHTSDVEAYDYYLRGRQYYYQYSKRGVETALEMFRKAIALDERYALAYCGIADCYAYLYLYVASTEENLERADAASCRALELDPLLAQAYASRGEALSLRRCYDEAEVAFEEAIKRDPQLFEAYYLYARMCFVQGRMERAVELFEAAEQARPEDYQAPLLTGQIYDTLRRPQQAVEARRKGIAAVERRLQLAPDDIRALYMGANGLVALGEAEKGLDWLRRALAAEPDDPMLLYNAGCIYALVHDVDKALTCLERSVATGLTQREWYENDSNLDVLRTHSRFKALFDRMP